MKKKFTFKIPDEMWIDDFTNNLTMSRTYEGPDKIDFLVTGESIISWSEIDYEHYNKETCKVIELDTNTHPDIGYMLLNPHPVEEYEDAVNPDGSTYQKISNPTIHNYYTLKYDESNLDNPWKTVLIVRNRNIPDENRVRSELEIANNYKQTATFDANITAILDTYISSATQYLEEIKLYYPWRYIEFNPPKGPEVPKELIEAFKNVVTE